MESDAPPVTGLRAAHARFTLRCTSKVRLGRFPGFTLYGALKSRLRPLVCVTGRPSCEGCVLRARRCAYGHLFETVSEPTPGAPTGFEDAPRPFVLHFPEAVRSGFAPGEALRFEVVLLGRAASYLPHLVYAVRALEEAGLGAGRRRGLGRVRLAAVEALAPEGRAALFTEPDGPLRPAPPPLPLGRLAGGVRMLAADRLKLRFVTPLRILHDGQRVGPGVFALHHLVRAVARRLKLLARFHGRQAPGAEMEALVEAGEGVRLVERDVRWHDLKRGRRGRPSHPQGGLLGHVVCEGDLERILPLLEAGQLVHAGSGTTRGLGQYEVQAHPC